MARIRSIHPDAHQSEKLAGLTSDAERLYWRLQGHCDDHGRCEDNPRLIWGMTCSLIASWTHQTVDQLIDELADAGLVVRYEAAGKACIQVVRWSDYQHPQRPKASPLPPVPDASLTDRVHVADGSPATTGDVDAGGERRHPRRDPPYTSPVDNSEPDLSEVQLAALARIEQERAAS